MLVEFQTIVYFLELFFTSFQSSSYFLYVWERILLIILLFLRYFRWKNPYVIRSLCCFLTCT